MISMVLCGTPIMLKTKFNEGKITILAPNTTLGGSLGTR